MKANTARDLTASMTTEITTDITVCLLARHRVQLLDPIYQKLCTLFSGRHMSAEFIVIANGLASEDEERLTRFSEAHNHENEKLRIIRLREKLAKAESIKAIQKSIYGSLVLMIETEGGELAIGDVDAMITFIDEGYDVVNGVRNWRGEPVLNKFQSGIFNWLTRSATGTQIHDLNSTIKILRKEALQQIPLYGDFYRFLPVLAERRGFRVGEVPVNRRLEQKRNTVYGPISYIRRFLDILNLLFMRQMRVWSVLSIGILSISAVIKMGILSIEVLLTLLLAVLL